MFCENCGARLEDNAKFCSNCGTKVIEDVPESAPAADTLTPKQPDKLYYPDPKRYASYMNFNTMMTMYGADDIDDFPDD